MKKKHASLGFQSRLAKTLQFTKLCKKNFKHRLEITFPNMSNQAGSKVEIFFSMRVF